MHYVAEASYAGDYKIQVKFEDGATKVVDLEPHITGPVFQPLKDREYFKLVSVNRDIDTVAWPNNADFSPDFLYEIGIAEGRED